MHGKGKYFYQNGAVYEGSWNQGTVLTLYPNPSNLNPSTKIALFARAPEIKVLP
jgi:hypothetical protein